nr:MAG TPA: hypothetical protein [Caudoviricetes sp.]
MQTTIKLIFFSCNPLKKFNKNYTTKIFLVSVFNIHFFKLYLSGIILHFSHQNGKRFVGFKRKLTE